MLTMSKEEIGKLPVLHKSNAKVGGLYQFAGGYIEVTKVYRLTEEEAQEMQLYYLDRVDYIQHAEWGSVPGGCALPGSDEFKALKIQ